MFLIEFENVHVHKEILVLWHREIIERIIRERLTPVVRNKYNFHNTSTCQFIYIFALASWPEGETVWYPGLSRQCSSPYHKRIYG
jgi:hypothetical protein